jgi:hypothetical protein
MLWTIIVILVILWLLGFIGAIDGGLIHLLLVVQLFLSVSQFVICVPPPAKAETETGKTLAVLKTFGSPLYDRCVYHLPKPHQL